MIKSIKSLFLFDILLFFIVLTSSIDCFWTIKNEEIILKNELNPAASYIIEQVGVAAFIAIKMVTTFITVGILHYLFILCKRKRVPIAAAVGIVLLQVMLMLFLYFGETNARI